MAIFLENLGPSLPSAVEAGHRLSRHIGRIDDYLAKTQPPDSSSSILNEPEASQVAPGQRTAEVPIHHFVVPHANYTIPLEYLEHIPWPGSFSGLTADVDWAGQFQAYNAGAG
ncbi:hypothetical protein SODALDRAFT_5160 [Sodiomyces alkalinus F11]|uniref:Uncharacterized protein n=1 Tax=Sodiomyces alkalinus (strain CBS 110278 / VKM F-3762 / F11) TaxID=1314773 RepID=A0A3N2Q5F6_SODAK|nr:hypothetical protein SODALDRAFT_5160 [Sodiomyces alkalinus F11]ROT42009.1 hypothetical protein SODALDRAFT_5160 [Sodiomyces alkalinus F11]